MNENTFQIILHNSGGHLGLILCRIKFSTITIMSKNISVLLEKKV